MTIKIAVGSQNPVKCAAVETILRQVYPDAEFVAVAVPSGVSEQPWGDDETRVGAENRARAALAAANADLGVGLEGGVKDSPAGVMTCAWCAIVDTTGWMGFGGGLNMLLPSPVAAYMRQGGELGPAMDALSGDHNTKQKQGAIGVLTKGLSSRQRAYAQLVALAAAPFVSRRFYEQDSSF